MLSLVMDSDTSSATPDRPSASQDRPTLIDEGSFSGDPEALTRGDTVGRYVVLETIGAGGMGVVYAAYDPDLDRKVAIKLVLPKGSEEGESRGHSRMLREAQALAKLTHPNVVTIHDVGLFGDRVFVAMEFVDGRSLREWARDEPRTIREILEVFVQAGQGLAAAHRAGLVHRDFKPENVLVATDGRAVVVDFGLARARGPMTSTQPVVTQSSVGTDEISLDTPVTMAGKFLGTPAYMAPEQHLGQIITPATDQFAFCVALWELLYDHEPFSGDTPVARAYNVTQGKLREPPKRPPVSPRVQRALQRGLRREPEQRHDGMEALLSELERSLAPRRRLWPAAAAVAASLMAAIGWAAWGGAAAEGCPRDPSTLQGAWGPEVRERVEHAFLATDTPFARRSFEQIATALDEYRRQWLDMHVEVCEATRIRHEQSTGLFDLRMDCLARRRNEVWALTSVFAKADARVVEHAQTAVQKLGDVDRCADVVALQRQPRLPDDPALKREIEALSTSVDEAVALQRAGHYDRALQALQMHRETAAGVGYPPLQARISLHMGAVLEASGQAKNARRPLIDAAKTAEAAGDDETSARARALLGMVVGDRLGHDQQGRVWLELAEAAVERLGGDPAIRAEILNNRALILDREGRYADEIEILREALTLHQSVPDADPLEMASLHNNLASALARKTEHEQAARHVQQALKLWSAELGPSHPKVAIAHATAALVDDYAGRYEQALKRHERALALLQAALGPDNPRVAEILNNLAITAIQLGDLERGEQAFRRVLAIQRDAMGPDHVEVASALSNLGGVVRMQERHEEALEYQQRALRIREQALPDDHPQLAASLGGLANTYEALGRHRQALNLRRRAVLLLERIYGHDDPEIVVDLGNLAYTLVRVGRASEAVGVARRTVDIANDHELQPDVEAFARIALARALLSSGRDRQRARALVEQALDHLGDLPAATERELIADLAREQGWELPQSG